MSTISCTVTNVCTCVQYDDETGEPMLDENGNTIPSQVCYDCYGDSLDDLEGNFLYEWMWPLQEAGAEYVIIRGSNVNWNRVSGWTTAKLDTKSIVEALSINTEWTLDFELDGNKLTCVRRSHDELGAEFTFHPISRDDLAYYGE